MNGDYKRLWIEALRSGEYKQGQRTLRRNGRYCCLGVLCEVAREAVGGDWEIHGDTIADTFTVSDVDAVSLPPVEILDATGLWLNSARRLANLNDSGLFDFEKIAAIIEADY